MAYQQTTWHPKVIAEIVLSGHLPPTPGALLNTMLDTLAKAPDAPTFVGPDHAMLEQMLAGITTGTAD